MSKPTYEELEQRIQALEQTEIRRKKAEKALRKSEAKYKDLYDNAPDMFVSVETKTAIILDCNQTLVKELGYNTKEEIIGRSVFDMYTPDSAEYAKANVFPVFVKTGTIEGEELQLQRKDGSKIDVSLNVTAVLDKKGSILYSRSVWRDITKHNQAKEELVTEKLISEEYINSLPGLFYVFDEQRFAKWNSVWNRISGYSDEELAGMNRTDFFEGKDKVLIEEQMLKTFREGAADAEAEFITKDGQRIPYYFTGLRKKLNGKDHLIGLGIDITDRKKADKALRENEEQFRSLIHRIQAAVVVHGPDTQITASNPKAQELLGLTEKQMLGKTVTDKAWKLHRADGKEMSLEEYPVNRVLATQQPLRDLTTGVCLSEKDDIAWVLVNADPVLDNKGGIQQVIVTFMDITEHKRAEEALKEASELNRKMFSESPIGISIFNEFGQCVAANDSIGKIVGATKEEVLKQNYNEIESWKKSGLLRTATNAVKEGKTKRQKFQSISSFGVNINIDCYLVPFFKEGKTNLMLMAMDISELLQAEEEKRKALEFAAGQSRHALIGQVAGKMAHDFNNILMGIMGNAQLAIMDCDDEKIKVNLEHINEFSLRGRDITNNLLSYSKDQEPKQTYFKIEDKIELVLKMLEKDLSGIEVSRNYKPGISELLADPGMIQDALVNIIQNSIHAMSKVENPALNLKAYSQDDRVYIEIEDNGCGIPKEHQGSIYTPSFTLKGSHDETGSYQPDIKGTGYGMSNVKKYIVEKHKGDIFLESEVGQGTKITIALRIIKDHLSSDEKKEVVKSQIYHRRRILLVEDEPAIADVQYQILTKEPFSHIVSIAANGQIAIDTFDRNKFDVVSLDYMLPGNINGLDVYNHIRKKDKDIPIMFISGNVEFLESMKKLKQKDPNLKHLSKPIDNLDYVNKINELIGSNP